MTRRLVAAVLFSVLTLVAHGQERAAEPPTHAQPHAEEAKQSGFHPTFDNIAGAIGILAAIIAVIAYLDQKRTNKENATVIALAEKYMKKEGAEQTIAKISEQLKEMPRLARRAVLQEQSERLKTALAENYIEWKKIEDELGTATSGQLEPDLEKAITDRLLPAYKKKLMVDRGQQRIAILGATLALISSIFPPPFGWMIQIPLGTWLLDTIFKLAALSGIGTSTRKTIQWTYRIVLSLIILGLAAFAITTLFFAENASRDLLPRSLEWAALGFSILLSACYYWLDRAVWQWSGKYVSVPASQ